MPRDSVFSANSDDLLDVDWDALLNTLERDPETKTVRGQRALAVQWVRDGNLVHVGPYATSVDGTDVPVPGHWVDLNWAQVNRLIRFLRAARDQAFGSPE